MKLALVLGVASMLVLGLAGGGTGAHTSATVADAVEALTGIRAHMDGDVRRLAGKGLAGPAVTMRLVRDDAASAAAAGLAAIRLIESAPRGSVLVMSLEGEKTWAAIGASFAQLAKVRGLAGFIVDGAVRDVSRLRDIGVAVYARGAVPGSAGGHYRVEAVHVPIVCGGVPVHPGDYIVADEDGIAVAPRDRVNDVLRRAEELRLEESRLLARIRRFGSYTAASR